MTQNLNINGQSSYMIDQKNEFSYKIESLPSSANIYSGTINNFIYVDSLDDLHITPSVAGLDAEGKLKKIRDEYNLVMSDPNSTIKDRVRVTVLFLGEEHVAKYFITRYAWRRLFR